MTSATLDHIRQNMRATIRPDEGVVLRDLMRAANLPPEARNAISARAAKLVNAIRNDKKPGIMEVFLEEYGLSTDEGIALMCLAEALLRVPDTTTIDALIDDKIAPSDWGKHLGRSSSSLVNASTWGLLLTGKVLDDDKPGVSGVLRGMVKKMGEPLIRKAVGRSMREMGKQFVLGRDIDEAMKRGKGMEDKGYTYSYDMLGEAAMTEGDARRYHLSYSRAISNIATNCHRNDIRKNPGISVKLSALFARYEYGQRGRVMTELVPRTLSLAQLARSAGMGFNIDAEEADRLDLSLDVIEAVLSDPSLAGWDGFGVVVQAYGPRASYVIDWLHALATRLDRRIMVRLVKGAYWDTEVKLAQVEGLDGFPVFTRKASTDVAYIANARKLLAMTDRIYPQFATHNAHTVAAILEMADDKASFEFQRLHGMGESLHDIVLGAEGTRCRIYAPVGAHRDLLAYLVRRLLENGANSSFVNQIVDADIPAEAVASDPFTEVEAYIDAPANPIIKRPSALFGTRKNSAGWDITDPEVIAMIKAGRNPFKDTTWTAGPLIAAPVSGGNVESVVNPAFPEQLLGKVTECAAADVQAALSAATPWQADAATRAATLRRAADLYEGNAFELFALATREAGKTLLDAVGELREAVDFLRFYADEAEKMENAARGLFTCISPWNFPLAIFSGQIAAALAAGNGVLAKPAETTPLIAFKAVQLLHEAGVPRTALQLLPGQGAVVGAALTGDARIDGVCFTGSTPTAQHINRNMADNLSPHAPLIAETGGLNAMIVDSSALPEQAVRDIVASAFQSAGQRCSALRVLYVQEDVAETVEEMILGAMAEQRLGDPWLLSTDIGPVIDEAAKAKIDAHVAQAKAEGRLVRQLPTPDHGVFVGPAVIRVNGIGDLEEEIFGPVLHIATFKAAEIDKVVDAVNASGYGLTFGLHTRIDDRVQQMVSRLRAGNIYVNRNQIGAVVGSQPFGGEGLSGTGPKAGGPDYVPRFCRADAPERAAKTNGVADTLAVQRDIDAQTTTAEPLETLDLPGPTGESNRLTSYPRGLVLCLGPDPESFTAQVDEAKSNGCQVVSVADGLEQRALQDLTGFDAVVYWGGKDEARNLRQALARRGGPLIPLITERGTAARYRIERHICIDTTASGGNTSLLAAT